jgi:hypothetical protein
VSGEIILGAYKQFKLEVIIKWEPVRLTVYQCSQFLGKSEGTVFRMLDK